MKKNKEALDGIGRAIKSLIVEASREIQLDPGETYPEKDKELSGWVIELLLDLGCQKNPMTMRQLFPWQVFEALIKQGGTQ